MAQSWTWESEAEDSDSLVPNLVLFHDSTEPPTCRRLRATSEQFSAWGMEIVLVHQKLLFPYVVLYVSSFLCPLLL